MKGVFSLIASIAREYLETIDLIRYGEFASARELRYLEGRRGMLHRQLCERLGVSRHQLTVERVRSLLLAARQGGYQ